MHAGTLGFVLEPMASDARDGRRRAAGDVLLLVDPNCRPSITRDADAYRARMARILPRADVVKVSTDDLAFLVPGADPLAAARWIASLGVRAVLLTDGDGPVRVLVDDEVTIVEVPRSRSWTRSGPGTRSGERPSHALVHAGTTRATLDGPGVLRATRFGVRAASIACTRAGADPPTLARARGLADDLRL